MSAARGRPVNQPPRRRPAPNPRRARPAPKGTRPKVKAAPRPVVPESLPVVPAAAPEPAPAGVSLTQVPAACDFDRVDSTSMFDTLGGIRALPSHEASRALAKRSLAEMRGYAREDLLAIAEVGYLYLRSGGVRLAQVIFEGLTAVRPDEAYFWLALGLVHDRRNDPDEARVAYERAIELDPRDATAELNIAELDLEAGDKVAARRRLAVAQRKAARAGQAPLERKAAAISAMIAPRPRAR